VLFSKTSAGAARESLSGRGLFYLGMSLLVRSAYMGTWLRRIE